ncbi:hypothetical protein BBO99_00000933 [Phytophthora kernoviae]|uniref:WW domain-containing protein n=1 Tax=Phytophthora kernoviae TaxID=325452 RepID=A0A3R7H4R2_9STRA|nr:hypothetical protein JM16_000738 [Phytophthora kernoviae]RLN37720.1 hypothetical protein BBI17_000835 [Phytophthora kernoviae]RLN84916.1 hypothetical protein BBO99_00000933 [Phytophthora kernoviae]
MDEKANSAVTNGVKEAGFLHDLAVTDFLSHAEEEFSTALTALNVLLSMSEKEQSDQKKLAGYRASLEALDILNERESQELFKKTEGHPDVAEVEAARDEVVEDVRAVNDMHGEESIQDHDDESYESAVKETTDDAPVQFETTASHDEDGDWLATPTDLTTEPNEEDSFEQEMAAVSEDEADGGTADEPTEETQDYHRSTNEPAIEEEEGEDECEGAEAVYDYSCENEEAAENGAVEETGDYNAGENDTEVAYEEASDYDVDEHGTEIVNEEAGNYEYGTEVANEETGAGEQYQLEGVEDADDEEAEMFGDWEKGFDPNSNHYFWFNHVTGESSWTAPEGWPYELDEPFSGEGYDAGAEGMEGETEQEDEVEYHDGTEQQEYDEADAPGQEYEDSANAMEEQTNTKRALKKVKNTKRMLHKTKNMKKSKATEMIEVILNDRLGKKIRVKCNEDDTVSDLKKLVAAQVGTRPEKIRIQKWYTIYKDHITLEDYEIHDGMGLELYYT